MRWILIVGAMLLCCCYRWLFYHRRVRFLINYKQDLLTWIATNDSDASDRLSRNALYARGLIVEEAKVSIALPKVEPLGLSQIASMNLRPLDRVRSRDADVAGLNMAGLDQAQGYFQRHRNNSFDPMFWIDYFLRLPSHLIPLIEKGPDVVKQLVQLLWYGILLYTAFQAGTLDGLTEAIKQLVKAK